MLLFQSERNPGLNEFTKCLLYIRDLIMSNGGDAAIMSFDHLAFYRRATPLVAVEPEVHGADGDACNLQKMW